MTLHHPERVCTMCRWYVLPDDDTIMLVDNVLTIMADYDPSTPVYLVGHSYMPCMPLGKFRLMLITLRRQGGRCRVYGS